MSADHPPEVPERGEEAAMLTEMEIELAREGHTYRNARWLATIDAGPRTKEGQTRTGVEMMEAERERQVRAEGWTAEHDAEHEGQELVEAAKSYLAAATDERFQDLIPPNWPWEIEWYKPSPDPVRNLVKAGALIAAEIDRLNRA